MCGRKAKPSSEENEDAIILDVQNRPAGINFAAFLTI
jgi:hypothetical protein